MTVKLKLVVALLIVLVVAEALIVFSQFKKQNQLLAENKSLTKQIAQVKSENENLSNRLATVAYAKSLTDEQMNELMRLRGEVAALRQQTNQIGNLLEENHQLRSQIQAAQNSQYQLLSADDRYTLEHQHAVAAIERLESAMYGYAETHGGVFPTSFDELKVSGDLDGITLPGNLKLNDFELVNAGLVNNTMMDKLILRQKTPYQNRNGIWVREYGYASGAVTSQYSNNGNFSAFEQQHMVTPPSNQNQ